MAEKTKNKKSDNQVGIFLSKLLEENNKNVRNIIREELEYYIENKAEQIAEMVVEQIGKKGAVISEGSTTKVTPAGNQNDAMSIEDAENMGYDMAEIRKRIAQTHNPMASINETMKGQGNANKTVDDNGNLVEVEENPELDKRLKKDYSNYL